MNRIPIQIHELNNDFFFFFFYNAEAPQLKLAFLLLKLKITMTNDKETLALILLYANEFHIYNDVFNRGKFWKNIDISRPAESPSHLNCVRHSVQIPQKNSRKTFLFQLINLPKP